jgi:hypothetical protein
MSDRVSFDGCVCVYAYVCRCGGVAEIPRPTETSWDAVSSPSTTASKRLRNMPRTYTWVSEEWGVTHTHTHTHICTVQYSIVFSYQRSLHLNSLVYWCNVLFMCMCMCMCMLQEAFPTRTISTNCMTCALSFSKFLMSSGPNRRVWRSLQCMCVCVYVCMCSSITCQSGECIVVSDRSFALILLQRYACDGVYACMCMCMCVCMCMCMCMCVL